MKKTLINSCYFAMLGLCAAMIFSCEKKPSTALPKPINTQTFLFGKATENEEIKIINLTGFKFAPKYESVDSIKKIGGDSLIVVLNSLKKPRLEHLLINTTNNFRQCVIYINPGDSITFTIGKDNILFNGPNAKLYAFFMNLDENYKARIPFGGETNEYKEKTKELYRNKSDYLDQYVLSKKIINQDFINTVKNRLKYDYYDQLINPKDEKGMAFFKENMIAELKNMASGPFNVDDYFDHITIDDFKNELIDDRYYYYSFNSFIRNYFINSTYKEYSLEQLEEEEEYILTNLKGEVKNYAIFSLVSTYFRGNPSETSAKINTLLNKYKVNLSNPKWLNRISSIERDIALTGNYLMEEALNSSLVNLKSDTVQFKDILAKAGNNIKAIDFWASWCGPCISEIKIGNANRKTFSNGKNVKWIYISIDDDKEAWINKTNELKDFGLEKESYFLLNQKEAALRTFLEVNTIPRYVVLDETNLLLSRDAPRPSDSIAFMELLNQ